MIDVAVLHSFVLVGSRGERTPLLVADLDERDAQDVAREVATAAASRLSDPEGYRAVEDAAGRAIARVEGMPGTTAVVGERLPGERLLRVFRHVAGDGPLD
jgi:hypothetical protein